MFGSWVKVQGSGVRCQGFDSPREYLI